MKKVSVMIVFVTLAVVLLLLLSPNTSGKSTNPCGSCHPGRSYAQYLDILEGDSANQIPSAIEVGETKTVSIVIENSGNPGAYSTLSDVSVMLTSKSGHFSVNSPTYNIGDLSLGQKTVTWQITGVSEGFDSLLIAASGVNKQHVSLTFVFSDSYSPSPSITVGHPAPTPPPTPTPAPTSAPSPTSNPTSPTPAPSSTPTPTPATTIGTNPEASPAPSTTNPLSIELTSPANGKTWAAATVYTINWRTNGGTNPLTITLEYSTSSTNGPWTPIATSIPDNGSLTWETPNATKTVFIRVFVVDSGNPEQNALTIRNVEINRAGTFPIIILPVVLVLAAALALGLFKLKRQKQTQPSSEVHGK